MDSSGGFLGGLGANQRDAITSQASLRRLGRGGKLFLQGDRASDVFIVSTGILKLTVSASDGREMLIGVRGPGDLVGHMELFDQGTRFAGAFALVNRTEVWVLNRRTFEELIRTDPIVNAAVFDELVTKLRLSAFRQLELAVDDVTGRVVRRLLELSNRFGEAAPGGTVSLRSPVTQQEIAQWAGVSRQAVVKELRVLRDSGVITTSGSKFTILKPAILKEQGERLGGGPA